MEINEQGNKICRCIFEGQAQDRSIPLMLHGRGNDAAEIEM